MNSEDKGKRTSETPRTKSNKPSGTLFLFVLLHLLIALPLAYILNIWVDEASTLNTTQNGLYAAFQNTLSDEKQAPLYYWALSLWRCLDGSIFFARLFSVLFSVAAIGLFFRLANRLWTKKIAEFSTFFFALHPYLVWASLEIRVYSLVIMLTLLLLNLFFDGFLRFEKGEPAGSSDQGKTARILYPLVAIVSLYSNYYLGFILVACFIVLVTQRRLREAKIYILQMILVGVFFLPLLYAIKTQLDLRNSTYFEPTNFIEGLKLLWGHFLTIVLPTEIYNPENISLASYLRLWFVRFAIFFVAIAMILKRAVRNKVLIFGVISAVVMTFLYYSYFLLGPWMLEIRHVAVLFPPLVLFLLAVAISIAPKGKTNGFYYYASIAILLTCSYSYALFNLHPNLTKLGDWERVSKYIEENESEDQPIFVFPNFEALALPYYYDGKNKVFPKENFHKWFAEAEYGSEGTWTNQIRHYVSIIPKNKDEIWLITYLHCQTTNACAPLEKYIDANYTTVKQKDFYNERVRLLRKK
ncbi:MAG: hypothetical protein HKN25_08060 [Pyrinomonadaceae bacterium]|nr:hypothetical protein [Pyrinomonadaceae bacterium]